MNRGINTLKAKKSPYLLTNDGKVNPEVRDPSYGFGDMESESLSDASKTSLSALSESQQYNLSPNQNQPQNETNFRTLRNISEDEKIHIIKTGFQLNQKGKISLKKYYERIGEYTLSQLRGYMIKYESIRRTKLYQKLKP